MSLFFQVSHSWCKQKSKSLTENVDIAKHISTRNLLLEDQPITYGVQGLLQAEQRSTGERFLVTLLVCSTDHQNNVSLRHYILLFILINFTKDTTLSCRGHIWDAGEGLLGWCRVPEQAHCSSFPSFRVARLQKIGKRLTLK